MNRTRTMTLAATLTLAAMPLWATAQTGPYTYHELKLPPGAIGGRANGMNSVNEIAGTVHSGSQSNEWWGVIWDGNNPDAAPPDLGVPPYQTPGAALHYSASDINDNGEVVGVAHGMQPWPQFPVTNQAFRWTAGLGFEHLPGLQFGGFRTNQITAGKITNAGNVIGNGVLWGEFANGPVGLHWDVNNQVGPHNPPGGFDTFGFMTLRINAINEWGEVVGRIADNTNLPIHACVWDSTGHTLLSAAVAGGTAYDINDCGQVVGHINLVHPNSLPVQGVLWESNGSGYQSTTLPSLTGDVSHQTNATAINNAGQIIGRSEVAPGQWHPAVWDITVNGLVVTDLSAYLPAPDPTFDNTIYNLIDINDNGYICGSIVESIIGGPSQRTPFVLKPATAPQINCSPPPPPPPALTLDVPAPVQIGGQPAIEFRAIQATPGETVYFIDDTPRGRSTIGAYRFMAGGMCPLPQPLPRTVLGTAVANANGEATIVTRVSATPGTTSEYIAAELFTCEISNVQVYTHP